MTPGDRGGPPRCAPWWPGLAGLIALAIPPAAAAEADGAAGRGRYAVLPFVLSSADPDLAWVGEAFAFSITRRLEALDFPVADARQIREAAESAGTPPRPATLAARLKLATALGARRAVLGNLRVERYGNGATAGADLVVSATVLDVAERRVAGRRTLSGALGEMDRMVNEIALEAAWTDPSPAGPDARRRLDRLRSPPLAALEGAMRALAATSGEGRESALAEAARTARDHPAILRALAGAHVRDGRPGAARALLEAIDPATQPDPWRLHLERAEAQLAAGDPDAARASATASIEARESAAAHVVLARIALEEGDLAAAREAARRAAALDPSEPSLEPLRRHLGGAP